MKTYTCSVCGGVFEEGRSEEEAREEQRNLFPDIPDEECDIVCDDCFKDIMKK